MWNFKGLTSRIWIVFSKSSTLFLTIQPPVSVVLIGGDFPPLWKKARQKHLSEIESQLFGGSWSLSTTIFDCFMDVFTGLNEINLALIPLLACTLMMWYWKSLMSSHPSLSKGIWSIIKFYHQQETITINFTLSVGCSLNVLIPLIVIYLPVRNVK